MEIRCMPLLIKAVKEGHPARMALSWTGIGRTGSAEYRMQKKHTASLRSGMLGGRYCHLTEFAIATSTSAGT